MHSHVYVAFCKNKKRLKLFAPPNTPYYVQPFQCKARATTMYRRVTGGRVTSKGDK